MARASSPPFQPHRPAGFTLVEMLVSIVITLIMVYALVEFMRYVSDNVGDGRATIEMQGQLRGVRQRLHEDLVSLTAPVKPWPEYESAAGYFEYYEGPRHDGDADLNGTPDANEQTTIEAAGGHTLLGDADDVLAFTIRARNTPFRARYNGVQYESQYAEVIWFTGFEDPNGNGSRDLNEPLFLFRRQLLVIPALTLQAADRGPHASLAAAEAAQHQLWQNADLSVRVQQDPSGYLVVTNSLADLARRENRFAHHLGAFPSDLELNPNDTASLGQFVLQGNRQGEDVMLSNLIAWDVRLFDPFARLVQDTSGSVALQPGDPGYSNTLTVIGQGAYVDLGYASYVAPPAASLFSAVSPDPLSTGQRTIGPTLSMAMPNRYGRTYDTWSFSYEHDGANQDGDTNPMTGQPLVDEAVNGLDDDGVNGVDDVGERETSPPYPYPLRGVQARIRVYDPSTRQPRQATVVADFTPE